MMLADRLNAVPFALCLEADKFLVVHAQLLKLQQLH